MITVCDISIALQTSISAKVF